MATGTRTIRIRKKKMLGTIKKMPVMNREGLSLNSSVRVAFYHWKEWSKQILSTYHVLVALFKYHRAYIYIMFLSPSLLMILVVLVLR